MKPKPFVIVPRWPPKVYKPRESFVHTPEMQGKVWGIVLADGSATGVDARDWEWLTQWKWHRSAQGYVIRNQAIPSGGNRTIWIHREIICAPAGQEVDHIDRNPFNNSRSNLRLATDSQNSINMAPTRRNTSGFKGVSFDKKLSRWRAIIRIKGQHAWLGRHDTAEAAARAYDAKARELFGEFAYLNFPQEVTT